MEQVLHICSIVGVMVIGAMVASMIGIVTPIKFEATNLLHKELQDVQDKLILPEPCPQSNPSWFGFMVTCREGIQRDKVIRYLENHGIQTRMLFAGNLIKHPCFDEMRKAGKGYRVIGDLANTDRIMNDTFWVGVYPGMTDEKLMYMAKMIKEAVSRA